VGATGYDAWMKILAEGRHARLVSVDGWEYVQRTGNSGIVVVIAVTQQNKLLLVEQFRKPVGGPVIELPAGLAGDIVGQEDEDLSQAAQRELEEETGYTGERFDFVMQGPVSAGLTDEIISIYRATNVRRIGPGGGDESENIEVHEVPLDEVKEWLLQKNRSGVLVDPKVFAALALL
jgi:ADP-ribose pyrophosphatase